MSSYPSPEADPRPGKKTQPLPWTHQETLNLIQAYQEKWYSLHRGQLKSSQWEEVAVTVAARCGFLDDSAAKTALQCRHKMEKLRRRYRSERHSFASSSPSPWPYYDAMEALEHGPLPISARPLTSLLPTRGKSFYSDNGHDLLEVEEEDGYDDDDEEEEEGEEENQLSKCRSINYILRRPSMANRFSRKRVRPEEGGDEGEEVGGVEVEEEKKGVELGLAMEMRRFAERIMRVERKRMEMMKETERFRMEMENRRIEMILDSHNRIVDVVASALGSTKQQHTQTRF